MGSSRFTLYVALVAGSVTSLETCAYMRCRRSTDFRDMVGTRLFNTCKLNAPRIFKNKHTDLYSRRPVHKIHLDELLQPHTTCKQQIKGGGEANVNIESVLHNKSFM